MFFLEPEPDKAREKLLEAHREKLKREILAQIGHAPVVDKEADAQPVPPKTQSPGWNAQGKPAWVPAEFIRTERGDFYRVAVKDPKTGGLLGYIYAGEHGLMLDPTARFQPF